MKLYSIDMEKKEIWIGGLEVAPFWEIKENMDQIHIIDCRTNHIMKRMKNTENNVTITISKWINTEIKNKFQCWKDSGSDRFVFSLMGYPLIEAELEHFIKIGHWRYSMLRCDEIAGFTKDDI